MSEPDEGQPSGGRGVVPLAAVPYAAVPYAASGAAEVAFDRAELNKIMGVYGRKVAEGEWRDYAIDHLSDRAVFSVFRRSSEVPLYRIEKEPRLARRQGPYSVVAAGGMILKRGHDIGNVLRVLEPNRLRLVES
jgi:hypothetical protein